MGAAALRRGGGRYFRLSQPAVGHAHAPGPARQSHAAPLAGPGFHAGCGASRGRADRKSTRLNSSHGYISYAVFCLKKKKTSKKKTPIEGIDHVATRLVTHRVNHIPD